MLTQPCIKLKEAKLTTLTIRPYAGETDLQPITDLINICDTVDQQDDNYSVDDLRLEFTAPHLDQARDLRLWEDAQGQLTGFGQLQMRAAGQDSHQEIDGFLYFCVHPDARGSDVESDIIAWASERLREVGRARGLPIKLRASFRDHVTYARSILEQHGFTVARYFFRMARPLDDLIPEPQFPASFTVRHVASDADVERWVEMYNLSFIDHWNFHPTTIEEHKHWLTSPNYRSEQDLIAVAPDGTFAAFCFCDINPEDNQRNQRNDGWIAVLGTRRGFRNIGLGRAMLLAGLHRLKADGADTAKLGVDAENPTGALRLYESVGFRKVMTWVAYEKSL